MKNMIIKLFKKLYTLITSLFTRKENYVDDWKSRIKVIKRDDFNGWRKLKSGGYMFSSNNSYCYKVESCENKKD